MKLLHNVGDIKHSNYHSREQILNSSDPLGFDGIYLNVYENKEILKNKTGVFFVMGDYIGKDNTFDLQFVPKLERYCSWEQIHEMCNEFDFEIGWHTWSHPNLTKLTRDEIIKEITPPFKMRYFAYPYGEYNQLVIDCVKEVGYEKAWSVTQGSLNVNDPDYNFKIYRDYL